MVSYLSNYSPLKFIEIRPARFLISYLVTFFYFKETMLHTRIVVSQPNDYIRISGTVEYIYIWPS